ncbi:MAG: amidase [Gemmatimonadaceae bacterium]|nr:amidase [Gemmatimonadaceae bacterium]
MSILDRDALGAFCRHTHVELAATGHGLLDGLTFGLKDLFDVAGHRTGFGSPDWLRTHEPAVASWSLLDGLLAAGATMVGKTHTEEMAFSLTGENAHYGTPINPAAPGRVPGGSSSGSAAAVAGGLVDFAIGSDTGGSVRAPASFCGIYGIRPTHGRLSLAHACPLAPSFDTVGWFARSGAVLEQVGRVLFGAQWRDAGSARPARVLLATDAVALLNAEAQPAFDLALAHVRGALGTLTPVTVADTSLREWFETFRTLQHAEIWQAHGPWVQAVHPTFGPQIATRFDIVSRTDPAEIAAAAPRRTAIRAHLDALLGDDAVLVMPTVPDIAPPLRLPPTETVSVRERSLSLLCVAGLGGLPQVNLPLVLRDGCPLGMSLVGPRGSDERLLDLARRIAA